MFALLIVVAISLMLNLVVPRLAKPVVEMIPGSNSNNFLVTSQKMFTFHIERPVVSSLVVALLVLLSLLLAKLVPM